jgi:hypothetical protein
MIGTAHPRDVAFLVPCHACGAPARFDVVSGRGHCAYCRSDVPFDDDVIERQRIGQSSQRFTLGVSR